MEVRISLVGLLMEGLQMRAFSEGDALPNGLIDHVRQMLVQIFSADPSSTAAPSASRLTA